MILKKSFLYQSSLAYLLFNALTPTCFGNDEDLAKKVANPFAKMIKVPFQGNYDQDIGQTQGHKTYVKIEPLIPISLNENWYLFSYSKLPVIDQKNVSLADSHQTGISDLQQHFFLSPTTFNREKLIWGLGPVFSLPTASYHLLGAQKWSVGPTSGLYKQQGPWTVGTLLYHLWSVAGSDSRPYVNTTYFEPRIAYTSHSAWTVTLISQSDYDWRAREWSIPVDCDISKIVTLGKQHLSILGGIRYWVTSADTDPHGVGYRFEINFLFPKK